MTGWRALTAAAILLLLGSVAARATGLPVFDQQTPSPAAASAEPFFRDWKRMAYFKWFNEDHTDDQHRLARDVRGHVRARLLHLLAPPGDLPRPCEYCVALEGVHLRRRVPGIRNRAAALEGEVGIERGDELGITVRHEDILQLRKFAVTRRGDCQSR